MGELHVNMHVTLDGVIQANGGPTPEDGDFAHAGWERPYGDRESGDQLIADIEAADGLLLGHTTYRIFSPYWPGRLDRIGLAFNGVPKYVASRGTPDLSWEGTTHIRDAAAEVPALREQHEQLHVWGSADLLQTLLREQLVDQLNLWVSPVVLGHGKKLFPDGTVPTRFALTEEPKWYPAGTVLLRFHTLAGPPPTVADHPAH